MPTERLHIRIQQIVRAAEMSHALRGDPRSSAHKAHWVISEITLHNKSQSTSKDRASHCYKSLSLMVQIQGVGTDMEPQLVACQLPRQTLRLMQGYAGPNSP